MAFRGVIGAVLLAIAALGVVGAVVSNAPAAPLSTAPCYDPSCATQQAITSALYSFFAPLLIPVLVLLVALFVLPRFGWKGAALSLVVIVSLVLWYVGIPGLFQPLKGMF